MYDSQPAEHALVEPVRCVARSSRLACTPSTAAPYTAHEPAQQHYSSTLPPQRRQTPIVYPSPHDIVYERRPTTAAMLKHIEPSSTKSRNVHRIPEHLTDNAAVQRSAVGACQT